jgi:hypothetical protein
MEIPRTRCLFLTVHSLNTFKTACYLVSRSWLMAYEQWGGTYLWCPLTSPWFRHETAHFRHQSQALWSIVRPSSDGLRRRRNIVSILCHSELHNLETSLSWRIDLRLQTMTQCDCQAASKPLLRHKTVLKQQDRQSERVTVSHRQSERVTASHRQSERVTLSHRQSERVTASHRQSERVTVSHSPSHSLSGVWIHLSLLFTLLSHTRSLFTYLLKREEITSKQLKHCSRKWTIGRKGSRLK